MPILQTIEFETCPEKDVSIRLFQPGSDTVVESADAAELANASGTYEAEFTDLPPGVYKIVAIDATEDSPSEGKALATGWVSLAAITGRYFARAEKDTISRVDSFTEAALQSLSGSTIRRRAPAWHVQGFDEGIIAGDSYLGGLAWTLRLTEFTGPNLENADSIKMIGSREGFDSFEWTFTANQVDDTTYDLTAELTSLQTALTKGEWKVRLVAHWDAADEVPEQNVTLIGPRAPLQIKGT